MTVDVDNARVELDRELTKRRGLHHFIKIAWPHVEPAKFVDNWHIGAIAEHLQACAENQIDRLIINVPPGSSKSLSAAVLFPAWVWTTKAVEERHTAGPATKFHYLSYSDQLSKRDARKALDLVQGDWFQSRWGGSDGVRIVKDPVAYYINNRGGSRLTVSLRGGSTGQHAHVQVVDDPVKPLDTQGGSDTTRTVLKRVEDLWSGTLATRSCDANYFVRIIVQQRLHDADLCGVELANGGYTHLMLPARFERQRACANSWIRTP